MKKVMSIGLVLAIILTLLSMTALAEGDPTQSGMYDVAAESAYSSYLTLTPQKADGTAVTGAAATVGGAGCTFYPDAEKLAVTFTGASDSSYYLMLVLNDDSGVPTAGNMTYIDQQTVVSGSVSFTAYPSSLANGTTYSVYLSSNAAGGGDIQTLTKVASFKYFAAFTLGDINEDNAIDAVDALFALRIYVSDPTLDLTPGQLLAADVNGDSAVDAVDSLQILRYYVGQISSFT